MNEPKAEDLIDNQLTRPMRVSTFDRRYNPVEVLLAKLNPNVCDVEETLVAHGVPRIQAWAKQRELETKMRSQARKAGQYLAEVQAAPMQQPNFVHSGAFGGNRTQRKAAIKQGDKKRKLREQMIERITSGHAKV